MSGDFLEPENETLVFVSLDNSSIDISDLSFTTPTTWLLFQDLI